MEISWFYCFSFVPFLSLFILSKLFLHYQKHSKKLPPSPFSIPIIGHLLLLKQPLHRTLQQLSYKYGPIFSLKFGFRSAVVISSPSAVEECFTKNDTIFANRPRFLVGKLLNYSFTTIGAAPYGPLWRNLRRLTTVEIFSTARLNMSADIRREEIKALVKDLYQLDSRRNFILVEMRSRISELSFNIIMRMVAGKKYYGVEVEDYEEAMQFRDIIRELFALSGASNTGDFLPFLQWFDFHGLEKKMLKLQVKSDEFLQGLIEGHRHKSTETYQLGERRNTMIGKMLALQDSEPEYYTDDIIKGIILILLTAGTDTSSVTIEWALTLLLNHTEKLEKATKELDQVIGEDRLADESDIPKLPYLQNIVNETLRLFPAVPLLSPHESSDECIIGCYNVPRKTMLLVNAWAMHRDPQLWDDPTSFKPERFEGLEVDAYKLKLIPFGLGRRSCPAAGLANRVVALTLATLLQCFDWRKISKEQIDMSEGEGLTMPKATPLEAMCKVRGNMIKVLNNL
ncbi:cytochrome P450 81Q32-like [Nicotiana tomentosiformis]|uniref:cytochrome P450 81Q32-like n=1 Tax=Nicotiana tomentosiformis TaxID=4098 RepID=UPI00051B0EE4|nr:cytochrome P450 81Q32-like [Nicotiana tomentosiformis]